MLGLSDGAIWQFFPIFVTNVWQNLHKSLWNLLYCLGCLSLVHFCTDCIALIATAWKWLQWEAADGGWWGGLWVAIFPFSFACCKAGKYQMEKRGALGWRLKHRGQGDGRSEGPELGGHCMAPRQKWHSITQWTVQYRPLGHSVGGSFTCCGFIHLLPNSGQVFIQWFLLRASWTNRKDDTAFHDSYVAVCDTSTSIINGAVLAGVH